MLRYGYQGRIYPINPKADENLWSQGISSITEVPETVNLVIISMGRDQVVAAFKECIQSGVKRVMIVSQGFADADPHGEKLQNEIVRLARESGIRVVGPNTHG